MFLNYNQTKSNTDSYVENDEIEPHETIYLTREELSHLLDEYRHENSDTYVDTVKSRNRSPIQLVHDIGFKWPSEKSPERSMIVDDSAQVERKFIRIVPRQTERPVESSVRTIPVVIGITSCINLFLFKKNNIFSFDEGPAPPRAPWPIRWKISKT